MTEATFELLQSMPLFGGMSARGLDALVANANRVEVAAGCCFFRESEPAQSMFVLERGRVSVRKQWNGREVTLRELARGDCFGEMALIDYAPRSATIHALEPSVAIEITADALLKLYEIDLEQFAIIQMNIAREISRRLRVLEQRIFERDATRSAPENGN
jgi:CRP-like cAMP-binding protein